MSEYLGQQFEWEPLSQVCHRGVQNVGRSNEGSAECLAPRRSLLFDPFPWQALKLKGLRSYTSGRLSRVEVSDETIAYRIGLDVNETLENCPT